MRIDLHIHSHNEDREVLRQLGEIMSLTTDLQDEVKGLTQDVATLATSIDAFIVSDKENFQKLLDAIAANNPADIQAAVDAIKAARAALAAKKADVESADATDNLPTP